MKTKMEFLGLLFAIAVIGSVHAADMGDYDLQRQMACGHDFCESGSDETEDERDETEDQTGDQCDAIAQERREIYKRVYETRMSGFRAAQEAAAQAAHALAVKAAEAVAAVYTGLEEEHIPYQEGQREPGCSTCSTLKGAGLRRHFMSIHASYGQYEFKCDTCLQKFSRPDKFADHRKVNCWAFKFFCSKCGVSFAEQHFLSTHTTRHHPSD